MPPYGVLSHLVTPRKAVPKEVEEFEIKAKIEIPLRILGSSVAFDVSNF